jgi:3-oxoacyl-[acyl-carrier protein] reductase
MKTAPQRQRTPAAQSTLRTDTRTVAITGANGGLGKVLTNKILDRGYSALLMTSTGNTDFSAISSLRGNSVSTLATDFDAAPKNYEQLIPNPNAITDVVLCHGRVYASDLLEVSRQEIETSMQVNFISSFELLQFFIRHWIADPKPRTITYVSSVAAKTGAPEEIAYHAAKRAMEASLLSIARAYAHIDIRANIVSPGLMNTPMGVRTLMQRPDVTSRIPLGKLTAAEDVADMILTIMDAPSITGQNIHINGGRYNTI